MINIFKLPKRNICFSQVNEDNVEEYKRMFFHFTRLHRLKLFKNKTIGVALIELEEYANFDEYYNKVNGKNSAAYYSRKAKKRKYVFERIDRNDYIEDIYEINTSAEERQGRKMSEDYFRKVQSYKDVHNHQYFGVLNAERKLVAYCNIGFYGEFISINSLLGHKKFLNDGIMYFMMIELNKLIFDEYQQKGCRYIMYDTLLGAREGLRRFKEKLGYKGYRVKWLWEN